MQGIITYGNLRSALATSADDEYRAFSMKGIPSERPFIGVRIPKIREIVAQIPLENFPDFLKSQPVAFEEVLARGMLIARMDYPNILINFDSQISYIDDWCNCDTFCSAIKKQVSKNREDFYEQKITKLLASSSEFPTRVGLVLMLGYVLPEWLPVIFDNTEQLAFREEYYVKMAIAWLVAECFIKYSEPTLAYLRISKLPAWTFNKAISKICDSRRVSKDDKEMLKSIRKS